jgi:hypothetical protein
MIEEMYERIISSAKIWKNLSKCTIANVLETFHCVCQPTVYVCPLSPRIFNQGTVYLQFIMSYWGSNKKARNDNSVTSSVSAQSSELLAFLEIAYHITLYCE